jgi:hypothetical protein
MDLLSSLPDYGDNPFERVIVKRTVRGPTTVQWVMRRQFVDHGLAVYQLQGAYGDVPSNEFVDVGLSVTNAFEAVDDEQRDFASNVDWFYRVQATLNGDVFYSEPTATGPIPNFRDWRLAAELFRKSRLLYQRYNGMPCFLLKRKRFGEQCSHCKEFLTGAATDSNCVYCVGTGIDGGYFTPMPGYYVQINPVADNEEVREVQGHFHDVRVPRSKVLGDIELSRYDAIVVRDSGEIYSVDSIQDVVRMRGWVIESFVDLKLLSAERPEYDVTMPDWSERNFDG